jgi:glycosyltransferase involved in cell wall biosynthesis
LGAERKVLKPVGRPKRRSAQGPETGSPCVLHIINNLTVGGAERFVTQLLPALARLGWTPSVLTLVEPNPLAAEVTAHGIPYRCMGRDRLNDPRLVLDLLRAIRELRPDVVHTHLFYADTFGRAAARAARVRAVVSTEHSTEGGVLSRRRRAGMRATAGWANRLVAVSEAVRRRAASRLGIAESSLRVIPNGIDLAPFASAAPLPRTELDLPAGAVVVGCVGRVVDSKGYAALLQAVARIRAGSWTNAGTPELRVLFAGDGPDRERLQARAQELGLEPVVRWLGIRHDVPRILKTIDLFAMPSEWEGHSIALLEAMAAGRACLVSDIPELIEVLGVACVRVQPRDPDSIAAGLLQLAQSPGRRADLGRAARERAQVYSIDVSARRYADLYEEVLEARAGGNR